MNVTDNKKVLSLQSHVVHGYVGNKSCVFPLQLHGFDVDFFNSVQFSNHTGYPNVGRGHISDGEEVEIIVKGLEDNGLLDYDYVLTGYIASDSFLTSFSDLLEKIRKVHPACRYVCDPVLGDDGKLYVSESLIPLYIEKLISKAWMITPNQFEAEKLTNLCIRNESDVVPALLALHQLGPTIVVISSAELVEYPDKLCCFTSYVSDISDCDNIEITMLIIDKLTGHFTGTGDCFAGLLLVWNHFLNNPDQALNYAVRTLHGIISRTIETQHYRMCDYIEKKHPELKFHDDNMNVNVRNVVDQYLSPSEKKKFSELCLIQCKTIIESPPALLGMITKQYKIPKGNDSS